MLIFDIETEPAPMDVLQRIAKPFDPASMPHPGTFDPSSVKTGNLKDQAKIDEKIEAARVAHATLVDRYESDLVEAEARHWAEIQDKAALNANIGCVCAIGYRNDSGKVIIETALDRPEQKLLENFWQIYHKCLKQDRPLVGFNIKGFDVPFIARRSWAYGIKTPQNLTNATGQWLNPAFVDLMERWQCGNRRDYASLDTICKSFGLQTKPDDCSGAEFARLLRGDDKEKQSAINYLTGDLEMTWQLAERMGVASVSA